MSDIDPKTLPFLPAHTLLHLLHTRKLTSTKLLQTYLARINKYNPTLNAIVTLAPESFLLEKSTHYDNLISQGKRVGPLHGLPMTIKDAFATKDMRTTSGMQERTDYVPNWNAVVVERLLKAGAIIMGKTNVPHGITGQETNSTLLGRCNNPFDQRNTTGGSSGGAACAVAAGLTALDIGSDSGGSIKQPSHCCGVYGHVPTHGIVPLRGHLPQIDKEMVGKDFDLMCVGPIARHPTDLKLILDIISGEDPEWNWGGQKEFAPIPKPLSSRSNKPYRIATWFFDPTYPLDTHVHSTYTKLLTKFQDAGMEVIDSHPPFSLPELFQTSFALWTSSSSYRTPNEKLDELNGIVNNPNDKHPPYAVQRAKAELMRHGEWLDLDTKRILIENIFRKWFCENGVDVLLCPIIPTPAFPHSTPSNPDDPSLVDWRLHQTLHIKNESRDGKIEVPYLNQLIWPTVVGMMGLPSTVVPLLREGEQGLPVGMQIVGPRGGDVETIGVAGFLEGVLGGWRRPVGFD